MLQNRDLRRFKHLLGGVYRFIFSRLVFTCLLLVVQMIFVAYLFVQLADYAPWFGVFCIAFSLLMGLLLVRADNIAPEFKISWMALFLIMPLPAGFLYLLWGNKRPAMRMRHRLERESRRIRPLLLQEPAPLRELEAADPRGALTARYLRDYGPYPVFSGTEADYYPTGEAMFPAMLEALAGAEHFIFVEFFIVGLGEMWGQIHELLRQKAAEGLDVRVIYDDAGSVSVLPLGYWRKLEAEGIQCFPFNPFVPALNMVMNNRDHRKILVVDGYTAFTGGVNLADEYINRLVRFGYWKDSGIRLRGEAAWSFTTMFLEFWNANRPSDTDFTHFRPEYHHPTPLPSTGWVQPFADSPVDRESISTNVYMELIQQAEHRLSICTPYLILDNNLKSALCLAAKRGVEVEIFVPGIPDKKLTYQLTRSYFTPLIAAGVHIYRYLPGFLHAKTWLCDGRIAAVGSINLDYRSLYLHFECSTLLYQCPALQDIRRDMDALRTASAEVSLADCRTGFFGTLLSGVLRMMAPLF
ncbi:MAG: phospholipase D-like domain-containing protein [Gemmiger sp.]|nr:phospholipase D-like domain-containing protein [Gemmiger sp.]